MIYKKVRLEQGGNRCQLQTRLGQEGDGGWWWSFHTLRLMFNRLLWWGILPFSEPCSSTTAFLCPLVSDWSLPQLWCCKGAPGDYSNSHSFNFIPCLFLCVFFLMWLGEKKEKQPWLKHALIVWKRRRPFLTSVQWNRKCWQCFCWGTWTCLVQLDLMSLFATVWLTLVSMRHPSKGPW